MAVETTTSSQGLMFGTPGMGDDYYAAQDLNFATQPVQPQANETGFSRITGAANRVAGHLGQLNERREARRIFEENYMQGERGVDNYINEAMQDVTSRLELYGMAPEEANRIAQYAVPRKDMYRDPQTGNVDIATFWKEAPQAMLDFEEQIKSRGIESLQATVTEQFSKTADEATSRDDYLRRVNLIEEFNNLAKVDPAKAEEFRTLYGLRWDEIEEAKEAEAERKAKVDAAYAMRDPDINPVTKLGEDVYDKSTQAMAQFDMLRTGVGEGGFEGLQERIDQAGEFNWWGLTESEKEQLVGDQMYNIDEYFRILATARSATDDAQSALSAARQRTGTGGREGVVAANNRLQRAQEQLRAIEDYGKSLGVQPTVPALTPEVPEVQATQDDLSREMQRQSNQQVQSSTGLPSYAMRSSSSSSSSTTPTSDSTNVFESASRQAADEILRSHGI